VIRSTGSGQIAQQGDGPLRDGDGAGKQAVAELMVAINAAGRWEWILQFEDQVVLPSKRVSDLDFATQEEAIAAGESARAQFVRRGV
jgi:hypothetical protein